MRGDRYLKSRSIVERLLAIGILIGISPVLGVVAVSIRVRMGRPILFRQARLGHRGKVFHIVKFRTMVLDAEKMGRGYFPDELNLVPPLGRFLRRTSLDELPQLINVLKGDMSFVGPRPALVSQGVRYTVFQARRLDVPQGITGLAQVMYRNDAPWSKRIELDVHYATRASLSLDLWILFRTIGQVWTSKGVSEGQTAAEVDDLAAPTEKGETP